MTNIVKADLKIEGDENLSLSLPFVKVDQEKRLVHGFATLDNVDSQNDLVTQDASVKAFGGFRGNIREMHQPHAVGRVVAHRPDMYVDPQTGQMYHGMFVSAYVSKGAPDTWEKVLDGTLSGFSIGGRITDAEPYYDEVKDQVIRVVKSYDLVELSLVDNPANGLANILTIEKSDTIETENLEKSVVNWCSQDGILSVENHEGVKCPICDKAMQNIGFIEQEPTKEVLKGMLQKFKGGSDNSVDQTLNALVSEHNARTGQAVEYVVVKSVYDEALEQYGNEEVARLRVSDYLYKTIEPKAVDVAKSIAETPTIQEETMADEQTAVVEETAPASDEVAKSEAPQGEADLVKAVSELKGALEALKDLTEVVKSLQSSIADVNKSVDAVKTEVSEVKGTVEKVDSRVDAVEADTAARKSGDLGGVTDDSTTKTEKSKWGGRFLPASDLYR